MEAVRNRRPRSLLRLLLLSGAVLLLAGFAWWGAGRLEEVRHRREALEALDRQDAEGARPHLAYCLRRRPADPELRLQAERAARLAGAYEEAEEHLSEAERLSPPSSSPEVHFERLLLLAEVGEPGELRTLAATLEEAQSPRLVPALEALARGYAATLQDGEARRLVDRLLERAPGSVPGLLLRARLLAEANRETAALGCYEQVLGAIPHAFEARLQMCKVLIGLGRLPEAVAQAETLRQQAPDHPEVLFALAQCRVDLVQPDEAERLLDRLLASHPRHPEGLVERGRLLLHRGRPADGERDFRTAVEAGPFRPEAFAGLTMSLRAQGRSDEAERSRLRQEQGEIEAGRLALQMLRAQQRPGDVPAYRAVADELMRLNRGEEAVAWFFTVLQQSPREAAVHRTLADYFERTGRPHRAARQRQRAEEVAERR